MGLEVLVWLCGVLWGFVVVRLRGGGVGGDWVRRGGVVVWCVVGFCGGGVGVGVGGDAIEPAGSGSRQGSGRVCSL